MIKIEKIREILPHRYPFLMVDRVVNISLEKDNQNGKNVLECIKNVSVNEPYFNGHFPDHSIMPGVLILEAMAQAAGLLGSVMVGYQVGEAPIYYLAGSDKVKFKRPVVPGDQLYLKATYLTSRQSMWKFSCEARVDGKLVSSADLTCARMKELAT
ncbi:3-hydroxyacyl-ACP dehydratase FabZ [Candidatus Sororendozoicomonas aggregata]|uniref:3-hydroxyacyl-ACP dehydratase FabZ n=1 Tax=Candidatus Sororendozoicomonas aggregata TaxID=3073239 RepID=UPI002ED08511